MKVFKNESLKSYNTFQVDSVADLIIEIEKEDDFEHLFDNYNISNKSTLIIGEGSNLLFTKDFRGEIVKIKTSGIEIIDQNEDFTFIKSSAGGNWHEFVLKMIDSGYTGLENLSLIPGTVGAAPVQNIGAYGVEISAFVEEVEYIDIKTGVSKKLKNKECNFQYRSSVFKTRLKDKTIIKSVVFKLNNKPHFNTSYGIVKTVIQEMGVKEINAKIISDAIIKIRESKLPDPRKIGNAGSFFKNPEIKSETLNLLLDQYKSMPYYSSGTLYKIPAAWLIEQCGFRGKRKGDAGVHAKQPLVLVNYGKASGRDILNMALQIKEDIKVKFGITLEPEVKIL